MLLRCDEKLSLDREDVLRLIRLLDENPELSGLKLKTCNVTVFRTESNGVLFKYPVNSSRWIACVEYDSNGYRASDCYEAV